MENIDDPQEGTPKINLDTLKVDFLRSFLRLLQAARIHQDNNKLLIDASEEFLHILNRFSVLEEQVVIQLTGERLFLQAEKVPFQNKNAAIISQIVELFQRINLPGLRFSTKIHAISYKSPVSFGRILLQAENIESPIEFLVDQLIGKFSWVEIIHEQDELLDENLARRERGIKTYSQALSTLTEVTSKITKQRVVGVRKAVRIAQKMVDFILEDEPVLLGMSTIRDYDDYTHTHSVNVAILSMCLGARIGLSPFSMEKLGICGLFHDLGKVDIPIEILNKEGKLSDAEFEEIKKHSLNSVRQIIKLQANRELKAKVLLPPFEHHLKYDLTGYPQTQRTKPISLFGRILAISDVFDAITSPRKYRPNALSPDRAIQIMLKGSGKDFDPILLKVFVAMLGPYPIGTMVELKGGLLGLVVKSSAEKENERFRPHVVLLESDESGGFKRGEIIDLAERSSVTNNYKHSIAKSFNPATHGVQPAEYII